VRKTGTSDRGGLVIYSNTGRIPTYLFYHVQVPSTGNLNYWDSRGLRRRFGLVAGAPSGRCGHALAVSYMARLAMFTHKSTGALAQRGLL
jgi:hypothetical protein